MLCTVALSACLALIPGVALAQMTHPSFYCWVDFGGEAVDLGDMCGGSPAVSLPRATPASAPTAAPERVSQVDRVNEIWYDLTRTAPRPIPAQLEDLRLAGEIDPPQDVLDYCTLTDQGYESTDIIVGLSVDENFEIDEVLQTHWIAIAAISRQLYACF